MRVLPHQQDTGGFFIAVLEKKSTLPWQQKKTAVTGHFVILFYRIASYFCNNTIFTFLAIISELHII
jgi:hypothetical protein